MGFPWLGAWLPGACLLCDARAGHVPNLCPACAADLATADRVAGSRLVAHPYAPPVSTLVHWMKFQGNLPAARTLGTLLADAVVAAGTGAMAPQAIVPVPLHRTRLRLRGYNQALELARPVSRRLGIPLLPRLCVRTRATVPQSGLASAADRRRNVAGVFRVRAPPPGLARVAIVDDVLTSGATVAALSAALRAAGLRRVAVWVCAGRMDGVRRPGWPPTARCSR